MTLTARSGKLFVAGSRSLAATWQQQSLPQAGTRWSRRKTLKKRAGVVVAARQHLGKNGGGSCGLRRGLVLGCMPLHSSPREKANSGQKKAQKRRITPPAKQHTSGRAIELLLLLLVVVEGIGQQGVELRCVSTMTIVPPFHKSTHKTVAGVSKYQGSPARSRPCGGKGISRAIDASRRRLVFCFWPAGTRPPPGAQRRSRTSAPPPTTTHTS